LEIGKKMYKWATDLFPINRSLTGDGNRETLKYIQNIIPELKIFEISSGSQCFDWNVPKEWNVKDAYIEFNGKRVVDFREYNLHLVGYSIPIEIELSLEELQKHLYSLPELPEAIPYITSYYKERWGFCISENQRKELKEGIYKIKIDSTLENGSMSYGEVLLKGETEEEIFLSTYICHPSMANNELSGPVVATALLEFIKSMPNRRYSYRVVFIPETIGSICYLSRNLEEMKKNIIAGFNLTTIGDDNSYSYMPTRYGDTLSDKVAKYVLKDVPHQKYSFLQRGSDERQYCSPGVDLPVATVCRTIYDQYEEYHTSLDNLDYISSEGLQGGFNILKRILEILEVNRTYSVKVLCEPQLGKRGLYPTESTKNTYEIMKNTMNFITYSDSTNDLIDISNLIGASVDELIDVAKKLEDASLIETC
jgi:aminopeptidase-like protein